MPAELKSDGNISSNNFALLVERRAYELYVIRGFRSGYDWNDWFEAQKMIEAETNIVEKDCMRSESFYESSHKAVFLPSDIDIQNVSKDRFIKEF